MTSIPASLSPPNSHPESEDSALRTTLASIFRDVPDPRTGECAHELLDILVIALLAMVCGAEGWEDIELFGQSKRAWLATFLRLPQGIPSHDTFRRVLSSISAYTVRHSLVLLVRAVAQALGDPSHDVIAVDGKTLCGAFDSARGRSLFHLVRAWSADHRLVLGQVRTDTKSNEITAIASLLDLIDIQGALVTIDAMGCQKEFAAKIVDKKADYLLALKENHPTMLREVEHAFETADTPIHRETERSHGRVVQRDTRVLTDLSTLSQKDEWKGLSSVVFVERVVTEGETTSIGRRYYLCSVEALLEERAATATREHWTIENVLHWSLDVGFREDACRVRTDHGPENLSTLRTMALTLLHHIPKPKRGRKRGIRALQKGAGWSNDILVDALRAGALLAPDADTSP